MISLCNGEYVIDLCCADTVITHYDDKCVVACPHEKPKQIIRVGNEFRVLEIELRKDASVGHHWH